MKDKSKKITSEKTDLTDNEILEIFEELEEAQKSEGINTALCFYDHDKQEAIFIKITKQTNK